MAESRAGKGRCSADREEGLTLEQNGNVCSLTGREIDIPGAETVRVRDADEFVDLRLVFAEDESDEETAAATEAAGELAKVRRLRWRGLLHGDPSFNCYAGSPTLYTY